VGTFPIKGRTREEQAEEQRLLYVAATRARNCLAIICASEEIAKQSTVASYCPDTAAMAASLFVIPENLPAGLTAADIPELDWLK
jgi:ATP-dependent exoDNAse (exonuclease V) beta subunit